MVAYDILAQLHVYDGLRALEPRLLPNVSHVDHAIRSN